MSALDLDTALAALIESVTGAPRLASDFLDFGHLTGTAYQLRTSVVGDTSESSNTPHVRASAQITILHKLTPGVAERTYTLDNMLTHQAALTTRKTIRELPEVYQLIEGPEVTQDNTDRLGRAIVYIIALEVLLA